MCVLSEKGEWMHAQRLLQVQFLPIELVHTKVLSHWAVFTLRWLHTEISSNWCHDVMSFFNRNCGKYCLVCAMICSVIFLSSLLNSWFWSNGSFWRMVFHALLIVFKIQFALGLPTLRFELSLGNADWVANATWCSGVSPVSSENVAQQF